MHFLRCVFLLTVCVLIGLGCQPKRVTRRNIAETQSNLSKDEQSAQQFVDQAMGFLYDLDQFPQSKVKAEVLQRLNRWCMSQKFDPQWSRDPMIDELPDEILALRNLQDLGTRPFLDQPENLQVVITPEGKTADATTFRGSEFDYMVGEFWCKTISNHVKQEQSPPTAIKDYIDDLPDLSSVDREQLGLAYLLFDWSVRHIHPVREIVLEQGMFRPGTSMDVWNSLQLAEGDPLERARVFIHLCRQQGIDAVVLKMGNEDPITQLVGVAIADQLYLFDVAYGLPVADQTGGGIQTLSGLLAHPESLEKMAAGNYSYPITKDHLLEITALIEAPSSSLAQSTALLEQILSGENKMVIHVRPSEIKNRIAGLEGISSVKLWENPFLAENAIFVRLGHYQTGPLFLVERFIYDTQTPFSQARTLQLQCRFDDEIQRIGARKMYLTSRIMEREFRIALPQQRLELLAAAGMELPDNPQAQAFFLDRIQKNVKLWRELASFNLGVIALESREYESAIDYFKNRTLGEFPDTRFEHATFYGLARSYEGLAKEQSDPQKTEESLKSAYESYTTDDDVVSPYRRGNVLRASRLPIESAESKMQDEATPAEDQDRPQPKMAEQPEKKSKPAEELMKKDSPAAAKPEKPMPKPSDEGEKPNDTNAETKASKEPESSEPNKSEESESEQSTDSSVKQKQPEKDESEPADEETTSETPAS